MKSEMSLEEQVLKIENGGLFSREDCRRLAEEVFSMYDQDKNGVLQTITAGKMLSDLYRAMNKEFYPTATDIASFARIFDKENKGKINFLDIQRFAVKYYCSQE